MSKSQPPANSSHKSPARQSASSDIAAFLKSARKQDRRSGQSNGLVFALDATLSRQPTWDQALHVQSEMFKVAAASGDLSVQLVYFRGFGECRASVWAEDSLHLGQLMTGIDCQGGQTQIGKVLSHVRKLARGGTRKPGQSEDPAARALVFVGDALEENIDELCNIAGELGLLKVPCFMFQEGFDPLAEQGFREIARLSGGAFMRFDNASAGQLAELLKAVAAFASGGRLALEAQSTRSSQNLLAQLR